MHLDSFLKLVEIKTKLASVTPLLLGTVYTLYHFKTFNIVNFLLFFASLIVFDMTTTAINNYLDYRRANKKSGYNYENHNAMVKYQLKDSAVITLIFVMLALAVSFGLILTYRTNMVVLIIGVISFCIGIWYSFGPVPISRTPFGEVFSGVFMGFVIVFLSVYIHVYDWNIVSLGLKDFSLIFQIELKEVLYIFLLSIPPMCGIANIMLANNICDIEDDIENRRYTLPVYIGRSRALWLYKALYYTVYIAILLMIILRVLPVICLAALLTLIPVRKNIGLFYQKQTKKDTFGLALLNFFLMSLPLIIFIVITSAVTFFT